MSCASSAEREPGGTVCAAAQAATLVVGLGNPILGDDAVGWRVVEAVAAALPAAPVAFLALGGLSLMEHLIGWQRAIIVDAIQTHAGAIGDVSSFPLEALPDLAAGHTTAAHDTSLQTALRVGRLMGAELPTEVLIVGIEAERVYDFSETLSPAVAAAVPIATRAVLELLDRPVIGDNRRYEA